jgi:hypothetical protein
LRGGWKGEFFEVPNIFRNGTQVGTSATTDTGLAASTAYTYTVSAYDAALNNSAQSSSISVTTQSNPLPTVTHGQPHIYHQRPVLNSHLDQYQCHFLHWHRLYRLGDIGYCNGLTDRDTDVQVSLR